MNLRDYQLDISTRAAALLKDHGIAYLAMEVRTGKTLTALHTAALHGASNVLFVTKKKAISSIEQDAAALNVPYNLTVINYEQLQHHGDLHPDLIIADEAHTLGAFPKPSERTKLLKHIVQDRPLILLSGTPTPESFAQLYHQLWISNKSPWHHYRNFYSWSKDYVKISQRRYGHGLVNDYSNADRAKVEQDTQHLILSFSQQQAGFEQLVEEEIIEVQMRPSTYKFADALKERRVITNSEGQTVLADTEVKLMQKLHQIYSGTVIVDEPARNASAFDDSKVRMIRERFAGKKIAIFYKFIAEGIMLKAAFNWTEDPDVFNSTDENTVFISQVQSGREGVNLSAADCLIMLNIDFSAVSYWQSRARLQTRDRSRSAKVYWLFASGGIEEKIYKVVHGKKDYTLAYFRRDFGIKDTGRHHPQAA